MTTKEEMSPYTPGPWRADIYEDGIAVAQEDHSVIAWVKDSSEDSEERVAEHIANARLMAAAPTLLDVLEDAFSGLVGIIGTLPDKDRRGQATAVLRRMQTAIRAAKGENEAM